MVDLEDNDDSSCEDAQSHCEKSMSGHHELSESQLTNGSIHVFPFHLLGRGSHVANANDCFVEKFLYIG